MSVPADTSKPRPGRCSACGYNWPSARKPGDPMEACPQCGSDEVVIGPHPPMAGPPCPSTSPFGSAECCLPDTEDEHEAGHGSALTGAGNLTGIIWPTDATDWERWAKARAREEVATGLRDIASYSETAGVKPAPKRRRWRVSFAWYDLWVGAYYDRKYGTWYFCPLPMLLVTWDRQQPRRGARRG